MWFEYREGEFAIICYNNAIIVLVIDITIAITRMILVEYLEEVGCSKRFGGEFPYIRVFAILFGFETVEEE